MTIDDAYEQAYEDYRQRYHDSRQQLQTLLEINSKDASRFLEKLHLDKIDSQLGENTEKP